MPGEIREEEMGKAKESDLLMKRFEEIMNRIQAGTSKLYIFEHQLLPPQPERAKKANEIKGSPKADCFTTFFASKLDYLDSLAESIHEIADNLESF